MMNRVSLNLSPLSIQSKLTPPLPPIPAHNPPPTYHQESDIFQDIPITLILPDGVTFKLIVKTGETVQEIKRKLDTLHGIPYSDATLYYNGKCMIDPLSLNDFPGLVCKTNVCLDVKISSAWKLKENVQYTSPRPGGHILNSTTSKNNFMDIGADQSELISATSSSSLNSISFVECVDAPINASNKGAENLARNTNTSSVQQNQPGLYSDEPPASPPLPNAFSDSPNMGKMNRRRPENETKTGTTTIDVKDDADPQCKDIQKIGNTKRWKLCFLF